MIMSGVLNGNSAFRFGSNWSGVHTGGQNFKDVKMGGGARHDSGNNSFGFLCSYDWTARKV